MSKATRGLLLPAGVICLLLAILILAPVLPLHDVRGMDIPNRFSDPSAAHWLGQDDFGRDVLARLIWGGRASLFIAITSTLAAAIIGTILGLLGGYFRGFVEVFTVRAAEILLCLPPLLLALLVVTILGPGTWPLILALTLLYTPNFARVVYASTLQVQGLDYVVAQRAMGAHPLAILWRTVLPNVMPPILVQASLVIASAMVIESGLSFLGLGVVPPTPSWGLMIRAARGAMEQAPLLLVWPSLALAGTILTFNLLCDRLQAVLDPRHVTRGGALWLRAPERRKRPAPVAAATDGALLQIRDLTITVGDGSRLELVRGAALTVMPGETVAVVGESGSGKTLTSLAAMGLLADPLTVTEGEILYRTRSGDVIDLAGLDEAAFQSLRGPEVAMVFQDSGAALNPVYRIGDQLAEALRAHGLTAAPDIDARVVALLRQVGIPDPERRRRAYPHELSGGQRQRVMIALAIANNARLLIADEPTTALDPTIQAQILDLLRTLKDDTPDMGLIFVTHDLAVVADIANRVVVMYAGEVVETGAVEEVFANPTHPYTAALIESVPEGGADRLRAIPGAVPQPHDMPPGCRFAPRCGHAIEICRAQAPDLERSGPGRATRCLRWKEVC